MTGQHHLLSRMVPEQHHLLSRMVPGQHHLLSRMVPEQHHLLSRMVPGQHHLLSRMAPGQRYDSTTYTPGPCQNRDRTAPLTFQDRDRTAPLTLQDCARTEIGQSHEHQICQHLDVVVVVETILDMSQKLVDVDTIQTGVKQRVHALKRGLKQCRIRSLHVLTTRWGRSIVIDLLCIRHIYK